MKKSKSLRALLALAFATLLGLTTVACQDDDLGDKLEDVGDEIEDAVD
jgi:hypothetical protein